MNDPLEQATKALRDAPVDHGRAAETRARLLSQVTRRPPPARSRLRATWLVPIAAALAASAALAANGARVAAWLSPAPPAPAPSVTAPPSARAAAPPVAATAESAPIDRATTGAFAHADAVSVAGAAPGAASSGRGPSPDDARAASSDRGPSPDDARAAATRSAAPRTSPTGARVEVSSPTAPSAPAPAPLAEPPPAAEPPPPAPDPAEALYRAAHELHFRGGAPGAAVAAWDRYLAAAPAGRFAAEAWFNRAVALLRAGREREGLAALQPFASGAYGAYRRDEARRLLDAAADAGAQ
ncbi:MAG: hypothetical protein IT374_18170 [Polyangiaceae bacterium]|nr:hypothetical protein [Polyangiaceae bacterium]